MNCREQGCRSEAMRGSGFCLDCRPANLSPEHVQRRPYELTCMLCGLTHDVVLAQDVVVWQAVKCGNCGGRMLLEREDIGFNGTGKAAIRSW